MFIEFTNNLLSMQRQYGELLQKQAKNFVFEKYPYQEIHHFQEAQSSLLTILQYLSQNPHKIQEIQISFMENQKNIFQNMIDKEATLPFKADNRFKNEAWQSHPFYTYIYQSYLNVKDQMHKTVAGMGQESPDIAAKTEFYLSQLLDALSPSNFIMTNPEILEKTLHSQGANLKEGLEKLTQDLENMSGFRMNPEGFFKVGENIATTPGDVVFKNDLIELIRYKAQTETVYEIPLLIVPPWINKYYIFDLSPENSFVGWLVSQGIDVYIISWRNPQKGHAPVSFEDYMTQGIMEAEKAIQSFTQRQDINFLGYCLGGVLLSCYMAYMGKKSSAKSSSFFATPLDFDKAGDLKLFITENQIDALEQVIDQHGIIEGTLLAQFFSVLRSKDMIWNTFVNNYMLNKDPRPLDFLFWNQDVTNLPAEMYKFFVRKFYFENGLLKKNILTLKNKPIHLSQIAVETFWLSTREDHIAPFASTLSGLDSLKSPFQFVLGESGHVAGVFNPSSSSKYGFTADDIYKSGSWWPHWLEWLTQRSGTMQNPTFSATLYPSPGWYVK